jgi:hypothetical protein
MELLTAYKEEPSRINKSFHREPGNKKVFGVRKIVQSQKIPFMMIIIIIQIWKREHRSRNLLISLYYFLKELK